MKRVARSLIALPRRDAMVALASSLMLSTATAAQQAVVPGSKSLADELQQALSKGKPLVVLISLDGSAITLYSAYLADRLTLAQTRIRG